jgi:hypothetical protein
MTWAPTTDQILNLDGVRRRVDRFEFELCDREWNPIGTLNPDRGQQISITNDTTNEIPRKLSGFKLLSDEADDVNTMSDRLRVYMALQNGDRRRLGSFMWEDESEPERPWGVEHHGSLTDLNQILASPSTKAYGWGRGGTITLIMFFLLFQASFELKDIAVIGEEANRGLRQPRSWEPGSTWLHKLNDMGVGCGFGPPWFNRDGLLYFDEIPDPAFAQPTVPAYDDDTRVIANSIVPSNDMLKAPNDFGLFDSGTDRLIAGRYQLPASAPHSFANRGWRLGHVESTQGMSSQDGANKGAQNLARKSDVYEYLTFSSTLDPRHDTYDIVDAFGKRWLEVSWTMELRSGGTMQHNLKRVSYDVT